MVLATMEFNGTLSIAVTFISSFLVLFNPFALYIYLKPIKKDLSVDNYRKVLFRASFISFLIYVFFALSGNFVFERVFNINFESFRIFGGVIIFTLSFLYIVEGRGSIIRIREDLDDMASEIAIPFFVGAGTISLAILMGRSIKEPIITVLSLLTIISVNYLTIVGLGWIHDSLEDRLQVAFDKILGILVRLTGLLIGAIGVDMIITGINTVFF